MQINQIFVGEPAQTKEPKAAMRNLRLQGEHRRQCSVSSSSSSTSSVAGGGVNIDQHPLVAVCRRDGRHDDKLGDGDAASSSIRYTLTRDGVVRKEGLVDNNNNKNNNIIVWELKLSQVLDIADRNDTSGWFDLVVLHNNDHNDDDNERLVALSHGGAIASIVNGVAELVGEFENGLVTAAWSPTLEFLALITFVTDDDANGNGTMALPPPPPQRRSVLLTMNSQFDVLEEATIELLASSHDGENNNDDDTATTLCWSPISVTPTQISISSLDAAYDDEASRRKVRFYAADSLTLLAVGRTEDGSGTIAPHVEPWPGITNPLSWPLCSARGSGRSKWPFSNPMDCDTGNSPCAARRIMILYASSPWHGTIRSGTCWPSRYGAKTAAAAVTTTKIRKYI
jgi:hypothetical protein